MGMFFWCMRVILRVTETATVKRCVCEEGEGRVGERMRVGIEIFGASGQRGGSELG